MSRIENQEKKYTTLQAALYFAFSMGVGEKGAVEFINSNVP